MTEETKPLPRKVYIDYNASTPLKPEVKARMIEGIDVFGNASSIHGSGLFAHSLIESSRSHVEKLIGADAQTMVFTSGGSESNNTVFQTMRNLAGSPDGRTNTEGRTEIVTSVIEHPCVMNSARYLAELGYTVKFIPVDEYGKIKMDEFRKALSEKTLFVSVMMANNEIGTIQDIKEISKHAKACGAWMHSDATQAVGKIPVNVNELGVDYLTLSAHKIYGPKGVGGLYVRRGSPLHPLIHGGHQENGLRAGTYNTLGILGFGTAAALALEELAKYGKEMSALRNTLRQGLLASIPGIKINGHPSDLLPNTLNVSFPGAEGEATLLHLALQGIEASTGSACASGSLEPSHVLEALGVEPELAHGSIRFSLGWGITPDDINYIIKTVSLIIKNLRTLSGSAYGG